MFWVDCCVISVINKDFFVMVVEGIFWEDLFYCINFIKLILLLLWDCFGDIFLLADYFLVIFKCNY